MGHRAHHSAHGHPQHPQQQPSQAQPQSTMRHGQRLNSYAQQNVHLTNVQSLAPPPTTTQSLAPQRGNTRQPPPSAPSHASHHRRVSAPHFPTSFTGHSARVGHGAVPPPPSTMANTMPSQYRGNGHAVARTSAATTRNGRVAHAHGHGHQHPTSRMPSFGATPPNTANCSMMLGGMGRSHTQKAPMSPMQHRLGRKGIKGIPIVEIDP